MKIETKTQIMAPGAPPAFRGCFPGAAGRRRAWRLPGRRLRSTGGGGHIPLTGSPEFRLEASTPRQQLPALFNHIVGTLQERFRYHEAERLGGFENDD